MSVNKVIILGRIGQELELKYTSNGKAVVNLSMATSEKWTDSSGQKKEKTEWHRVIAYGKQAELLHQYCAKGSELYIEGRLATRMWEKDGHKNYTTEIVLQEMNFIGGKRKEGASTGDNQGSSNQKTPEDSPYELSSDASFAADDIPF